MHATTQDLRSFIPCCNSVNIRQQVLLHRADYSQHYSILVVCRLAVGSSKTYSLTEEKAVTQVSENVTT